MGTEEPNPIRLQPRDLAFLSDLGTVALMGTEDVWHRYFPDDKTGKAVLRRLRQLTAHGILRRITVSVSYGKVGRLPTYFALTPRGAELLTYLTGETPARVLRSDLPAPETLLHRIGVARTVLKVNDACQQQALPPPTWILEQDTVPGADPTAHPSERFILFETFIVDRTLKVSCRPDASCLLKYPWTDAGGNEIWRELPIYWEYDRSTETHTRFETKLAGYEALLAQHAYRRHWPELGEKPVVRIFFILQSEERLLNLSARLRSSRLASHIRLTTVAELDPARLLTTDIWRDFSGKRYTLLRTPKPDG